MKPRRSPHPFVVSVLVVLLLPALSQANDTCEQIANNDDIDHTVRVSTLATARCLGEDNDRSAIAKHINDALMDTPDSAEQRLAAARSALEFITAHVASVSAAYRRTVFVEFPIDDTQVALTELSSLLRDLRPAPKTFSWSFNTVSGTTIAGSRSIDVKSFGDRWCHVTPPKHCDAAYGAAQETVRIVLLTHRVLDFLKYVELQQYLSENKARQARWESYFSATRPQYLWEVIANGAWALRCDDRPKVNGVPQGYLDVPRFQWIVAHPDAAFEYLDAAPDGNRAGLAAVLEVIGFNRWGKWNEDNTPGFQFGASAMLVTSDRATVDDLGWGVLLHFDGRFSIGAADHDGDLSVVVNTNLAKLWTKVSKARKEKVSRGE